MKSVLPLPVRARVSWKVELVSGEKTGAAVDTTRSSMKPVPWNTRAVRCLLLGVFRAPEGNHVPVALGDGSWLLATA